MVRILVSTTKKTPSLIFFIGCTLFILAAKLHSPTRLSVEQTLCEVNQVNEKLAYELRYFQTEEDAFQELFAMKEVPNQSNQLL